MNSVMEDTSGRKARIDFGRAVVRFRRGPVSLRFNVRPLVASMLIVAVAILVSMTALASGQFQLTFGDVVLALLGKQDGLAHTVVVEWRAPRVLSALVFGAALGASGAIFQSLTRNPLASPDIIGFSAGSYTGALLVMVAVGGSYLQIAAGALTGGLATALVVYVFAYNRGLQGFRLIIVGIAISAMLASLNTWLMLTAELEVAMSASLWGAGSLNAIAWEQVLTATAVIAVLLTVCGLLGRPMRQLEMGDDAAKALGVRAEPARLSLIIVGVALTATVTAAAGPITFVSLAAPQIARRLTRTPGVTVGGASCVGALLLACSDYIAQHLLPSALPVGLVTVVIGGTYLVWLLIHEVRRRA